MAGSDLETSGGTSLARRAAAVGILAVAGWFLLKVIIGVVTAVATTVAVVLAIIAVIWALRSF